MFEIQSNKSVEGGRNTDHVTKFTFLACLLFVVVRESFGPNLICYVLTGK